jgi:hypothetical protein
MRAHPLPPRPAGIRRSAIALLHAGVAAAALSAPTAAHMAAAAGPADATFASRPADPPADPAGILPEDHGWPRAFEASGATVRIHQPQVADWRDFDSIRFYAAVSVDLGARGEAPDFGTILVRADTDVAIEERTVVLSNLEVERLEFRDAPADAQARLRGTVLGALPLDRPVTISLDRLLASMDLSKVRVPQADIDLAPPPIHASESPAVLVVFPGKPRFQPVPDARGLLYAINTNWDCFRDAASDRYLLLDDGAWYESRELATGDWSPARPLPAALGKLPDDGDWSDVRAAVPGRPATKPLRVVVSDTPAELVVTDGPPEFTPIPDSTLMLVSNAENDLLLDASTQTYYLLSAGRWFSAKSLQGPWSAASASLPDAFRALPSDSEAARLLVAVPGTRESAEAAVLASIPQKATVSRGEVSMTVRYEGQPAFRPIEGTTVQYATNSPQVVLLADARYFCCFNGVWFTAPTPTGAWAVASAVPASIYTIPPTSPFYFVTFVKVYDATPDAVVCGYTGGYSGATVAETGVVMFGLGIALGVAIADDLDCCWGWHYRSCYFSYGCGAHWNHGCGGYVCGGFHYGPYGGCGHWASYDPATGRYGRGAFEYGPSGARGYRAAYNPTTGVAAARAGAVTPYAAWSRGVVTNGDRWVSGGRADTRRGEGGFVRGSEGAGAARIDGRFGNGVAVGRTKDGDLYASRDGSVYRRGDDGWEQVGGERRGLREPEPELRREAEARTRSERAATAQRDFRAAGGWGAGSRHGSLGGRRPTGGRGGRSR